MFIREVITKNNNTGEIFRSFKLLKTEKLPNGQIKQLALLNLGPYFAAPKEKWKRLCNRITQIVDNQDKLFSFDDDLELESMARDLATQLLEKNHTLPENNKTTEESYDPNIEEMSIQCHRSAGAEHVSLHGIKLLGLQERFMSLGFGAEKSKLAVALIVARMVYPSSAKESRRWLTNRSALAELLNIDLTTDYSLHEISDLIYSYKSDIDANIFNIPDDLFNSQKIVSFYDITNIHDDQFMTLALVLDDRGFVRHSEILPDFVYDPTTLAEMMKTLEVGPGHMVVLNQDMATAENFKWLTKNGYSRLVVNRKQKRYFDFSKAQLIKVNSAAGVEIYKEGSADGLANKILVRNLMNRPGIFTLTTNDKKMSIDEILDIYSYLTDIDSVFKSRESKLGLNHIFNYKSRKVESYLFISVLAYQCIQAIRQRLKKAGIDDNWLTIRGAMSTQARLSFVFPMKDGRKFWIRKPIEAKPDQLKVYRALGLNSDPGGEKKKILR
ncbi:MAG: hypothetical protein LBT38_12115 [Deltaproteobacteria bacterium]|jgi:hypothetical protein|nr:hypothetical protein [Deltaproteobacteria bacterium]